MDACDHRAPDDGDRAPDELVGARGSPGSTRLIGRRTSNEVIRGIPGSPTALHGVPYQLTEEFVAVYRMHPFILDEFSFRALADDHYVAGPGRCPRSVCSTCASG